ncbi:MAG: hypothetical protein DRI95_11405 [Bacteroidetes bacterium]|nr:MAG: hypothetical protein DRI95_11405 [Bacteroidota bacterium]
MAKKYCIFIDKGVKLRTLFAIFVFVCFSSNIFSQINQLPEESKQKVNTLETEANGYVLEGKNSDALDNFIQIAEVYKNNKLYNSSIEYYEKSLVQAKKVNSAYKLNSVYFNLINLYKVQGKWSESLNLENEKVELSRVAGNRSALANDLINIAYTLRKLNKNNEAIKILEEALKISLFDLKNEQLTLKCYKELANNYNQLGNTEKYNEYTNLIKRVEVEKTTNALENRTLDAESKVRIKDDELSETNTKLGEVTDSLSKVEKLTHEQQLEIELQNAEIAKQEVELKVTRNLIYFLLVIFVLTLMAAILWYIQYKKKHEALKVVQLQKEEIIQQKEEIQTQSDRLKLQRDELYRSNKTKEKLFSVIAHDLKNPIHALIGFSDLLINEKDNLNNEEKEQYIEFIHTSSLQIHNLLENLLKWAQSQSSSIKFNPENIDINELIDLNIGLFKETSIKKQIELVANEKTDNKVYADKNMVNTIIRNLINNALKFTNEGGKISLSTKTIDQQIEVSVTDTGIGMTEEIIKKILDSEELYSSAGTMDEPGTGLGLAICHEFLDAHNNKLQIRSEPGKGSTFFFNLPVSKEA